MVAAVVVDIQMDKPLLVDQAVVLHDLISDIQEILHQQLLLKEIVAVMVHQHQADQDLVEEEVVVLVVLEEMHHRLVVGQVVLEHHLQLLELQ